MNKDRRDRRVEGMNKEKEGWSVRRVGWKGTLVFAPICLCITFC